MSDIERLGFGMLGGNHETAATMRSAIGKTIAEAWRAFLAALDEFEAAANLWVDPVGPTAADMERLCQSRQRVLECARVLAALRSEAQGEGDALGMLQASVDEYLWEAQNNPQFDAEAAFAALSREIRAALRSEAQGDEEPVAWLVERRGVEMFGWHPVHVYLGKQNAENIARVLRDGEWDVRVVPLYRAAHRSDAQKGDADALDLIRWAESRHAALEPVAGNIMPPGTYACYAGDGDEPYMGPGILGAIRAARRGEAQGEDRWEDLVFGPIVEAYNEAHAAHRGEGGGVGD